MIAKLINLDDAALKPIGVHQLPVVLGSNSDAGIVIDSPKVSDLHCLIDECDGTLVVHDLASSDGTFVNNEQVTDAPVAPGDIVSLGSLDFMVSYEYQRQTRPDSVSELAQQNLFSE